MTTQIIQKVPYLRNQRKFPDDDIKMLSKQVDQAYIDIATKVNERTIGIFPTNFLAITGEKWYLKGQSQEQQTLREVYEFTGPSLLITIPHNIPVADVDSFTRIYGTFTDGTNCYPLPYVDVLSVTNQVNIVVTQNDILITSGAGTPPSIVSGLVILEFLSVF